MLGGLSHQSVELWSRDSHGLEQLDEHTLQVWLEGDRPELGGEAWPPDPLAAPLLLLSPGRVAYIGHLGQVYHSQAGMPKEGLPRSGLIRVLRFWKGYPPQCISRQICVFVGRFILGLWLNHMTIFIAVFSIMLWNGSSLPNFFFRSVHHVSTKKQRQPIHQIHLEMPWGGDHFNKRIKYLSDF